jgi:hypothetical protein
MPAKIRYEMRETNVHPICDGAIGELEEHFEHYSFNKGLVPWLHKHNFYSTMEAREAVRVRQGTFITQVWNLFARDKAVRRRALKNLSFYPPLRDYVRFLYVFFVRLGILDGRAGFHYACMISMYEYWIELKMREQCHDWAATTTDCAKRVLSGAAE